jgi:hypothetical protein
MTKDISTESGSEKGNAGQDDDNNSLDSIINSALDDFEANENDSSATVENANKTNLESANADIPEEVAKAKTEDDESADKADILNPPEHWPSEHKAIFETLSPEAKKAWLHQAKDAERGLSKQGEKYAEQRKSWEAVDANLKNFESMLGQSGISKPDFVNQIIQGYTNLINDPVAHIKMVMQQAKLTPEQLFGTTTSAEKTDDTFVDPMVKKLQDELNGVKQFNQQMQNAWQQAQQQAQFDHFQTYVNNAANLKDEEGNPVFPHFDEDLADTMADIITGTPAIKSMADPEQKFRMAYDLAIAKNHNKFVEMEVQRQKAALEAERGKAARTIKPQVGSHVPAVKANMSLDDIISETLGEYGL